MPAMSSMMIGLSMIRASEKVTPKIARLGAGFGRRAITAATIGCSIAIISHIAASGSQNQKIRLGVKGVFSVMP